MTPEEMLLQSGIEALNAGATLRDEWWRYFAGDHDLPFAPEGVNEEYLALREIAILPLIGLAVATPVQRLRIKGMLTTNQSSAEIHRRIWQTNKMDAGQRKPYLDAFVYGEGYISVWPDRNEPSTPIVRAEDPNLVWVERDTRDAQKPLWAIKRWTERLRDPSEPSGMIQRDVGVVYTDTEVHRFHRGTRTVRGIRSVGPFGQSLAPQGSAWELAPGFPVANPLRQVPFVPFVTEEGSDGRGASRVARLIGMQRSIDTMRFNLLLAAQFAAFRQRVAVGYDPIVRDSDGNIIYQTDTLDQPVLDPITGQPIPLVHPGGRVGVDRLLVFPGADTNVFDLAESNLQNYVYSLEMLVATFSSVAQVPPQYFMGKLDGNLSGELMTATEVTLQSLIKDCQTQFGESMEGVAQLVGAAIGDEDPIDPESEVIWDETAPANLSEIGDFASKMVPLGYPMREVVQTIPGVSQARAARMDLTPPKPPEPAGAASASQDKPPGAGEPPGGAENAGTTSQRP